VQFSLVFFPIVYPKARHYVSKLLTLFMVWLYCIASESVLVVAAYIEPTSSMMLMLCREFVMSIASERCKAHSTEASPDSVYLYFMEWPSNGVWLIERG
jgi:hypothetical protein